MACAARFGKSARSESERAPHAHRQPLVQGRVADVGFHAFEFAFLELRDRKLDERPEARSGAQREVGTVLKVEV